jgi:hypothetical protein
MTLPRLALSIRQPWAFGVIHAGKPVENRSWKQPNPALRFRGPVCIHASRGMTRAEYEDAEDVFDYAGAILPPAHELMRGGIIGVVEVVDIVRKDGLGDQLRNSPWFFGPVALVLANPHPVDFIPCAGQLGFFEWRRGGQAEPPARWMLPKQEPQQKPLPLERTVAVDPDQGRLL